MRRIIFAAILALSTFGGSSSMFATDPLPRCLPCPPPPKGEMTVQLTFDGK